MISKNRSLTALIAALRTNEKAHIWKKKCYAIYFVWQSRGITKRYS